jgi:hypothetical protein
MYDRTIAMDHRIYKITISSTPTKVVNLLNPTHLADYNEYIATNKRDEAAVGYNRDNRGYKRIPLDGYLSCQTNSFEVATFEIGPWEYVHPIEKYTIPGAFWLDKLYVRGAGDLIVRVFFS